MNTRPGPLLVGGGDEGLKLGKEGCGKGVWRGFGMGNRVCRSPEDQEEREEEARPPQLRGRGGELPFIPSILLFRPGLLEYNLHQSNPPFSLRCPE